MAVPGFQTWFTPFLKALSDGQVHLIADLYQELADQMKLTPEDKRELLPSGKQQIYKNRIGWARTYLGKAGLLEVPNRGECRITSEGLSVLSKSQEDIDVKYLKRYPTFVSFHQVSKTSTQEDTSNSESIASPDETLEMAYLELRNALRQEVLDKVKKSPPEFFESLVIELLVRMGYGGSQEDAGKTLGRSGDGGIDGKIKEDRLGLDFICVQAKRWESNVGRPIVQAFAGSLDGFRARKGVLITTSGFTKEAIEYVSKIGKSIVLIDGEELTRLMFEYDLGVTPVKHYVLKKLDHDYFEES